MLAAGSQYLDGIVGLSKGQAFIERSMGIGLANEDEVEAVV